jgi:hypothetical protein
MNKSFSLWKTFSKADFIPANNITKPNLIRKS